ncbi:HGGxSTG domain-containing protein [Aureimonas phyllosphaerae]|uniref:HGGxSTG domain-containing protein n=1 Tax=Aureimonas phyllosphaerae TaxID=1166078 RepID=UPI003A5C42BE
MPKCEAKTRTTGEPCQNLAMANGRCRLHGGATPKGDRWHLPVWPNGSAPGAIEKANRKSADLEKRKRKKAKRLARRSPDELAEHDAWQKARQPGSAKRRKADRETRRQQVEAHAVLQAQAPPRGINVADRALANALAVAEANLRALDRQDDLAEAWINGTGVFG